ncbi:MAG: hypothetical protein ACD_7C00509G0014 [uncultured bacterium]|nr:MAG: hypothetical protein ACD_7C00509G0014 [uncultured bacterium]
MSRVNFKKFNRSYHKSTNRLQIYKYGKYLFLQNLYICKGVVDSWEKSMNLILEINNLNSCNFGQKKLKLTIEETIEKAGVANFLKKDVLVSIGVVSEMEMRKINKKYRDKDSSTDILSFGDFNSTKELVDAGNENLFLGELLVCCEDVKRYCQEKNIIFEKEFFEVISHGTLHLLGFKHGKEMFELQKSVADQVCAGRILEK